jgi:selenocysteine lyase/cysteine desulfurase
LLEVLIEDLIARAPTAVDFHFAVGSVAKEKHMRALRDRWANAVRDLRNVEICLPDEPVPLLHRH